MPKISVIVPVYKVEPYLRRCVDSILSQTFTDFELILVDDGSPDNCGAICDEYAKKDGRVQVVHKENSEFESPLDKDGRSKNLYQQNSNQNKKKKEEDGKVSIKNKKRANFDIKL